jgi:hypothetical protein
MAAKKAQRRIEMSSAWASDSPDGQLTAESISAASRTPAAPSPGETNWEAGARRGREGEEEIRSGREGW